MSKKTKRPATLKTTERPPAPNPWGKKGITLEKLPKVPSPKEGGDGK